VRGVLKDYELIFVNDASTDGSEKILRAAASEKTDIKIINMSRRFGVSPCVFAGMRAASGDVVVYMDADLQDPPELIPRLLDEWAKGADVVHTVRTAREGEPLIKLWITRIGYLILRGVSEIDLPIECGDFKLLSRRAVNNLLLFNEQNPFMRGLVRWIGFNQTFVPYRREARHSGLTKFNILNLSVISNFFDSALISFSSKPLQLATISGITGSVAAFILILHVLWEKLLGHNLPGWSAIMVTVLFLGSIQLITLGILGLYVASIYFEVKRRPNYIVESTFGFQTGQAKDASSQATLNQENPASVSSLKHCAGQAEDSRGKWS
jgi:dolichol-phosphate mannosyltransferase